MSFPEPADSTRTEAPSAQSEMTIELFAVGQPGQAEVCVAPAPVRWAAPEEWSESVTGSCSGQRLVGPLTPDRPVRIQLAMETPVVAREKGVVVARPPAIGRRGLVPDMDGFWGIGAPEVIGVRSGSHHRD